MNQKVILDIKAAWDRSLLPASRLERSRFASGGRFRVRLIRHLRLPG
jgi:hypothetical protein